MGAAMGNDCNRDCIRECEEEQYCQLSAYPWASERRESLRHPVDEIDQWGSVQRGSVARRTSVEQNFLVELRRARLEENKAKAAINASKSSTPSIPKPCESNEIVTVDACKQRFLEKMGAIHDLAGRSLLGEIAAERVINLFASDLGMANIDKKAFLDSMQGIAGKEVTGKEIMELFDLLDCDGLGYLTHAQWVSAFPIFFCSDDDIHKLVFRELDEDEDGSLSEVELAKYATPFVNMLLSSGQVELRQRLRVSVSRQVFHSISDHCGGNKVTSEEFAKWFKENSISEHAFHCLDAILNNRDDSQGSMHRASANSVTSQSSKRFTVMGKKN